MYARWTLDRVVEIVHMVSIDYVARPDFYNGPVPDEIVDFRSSYGYLRNYPDMHQRRSLNYPVFGLSDGYSSPAGATTPIDKFHQYREPLFKSCVAYTERSIADSKGGLEAVIQAMTFFPSYLRTFDGHSIKSSYGQIHFISELSYELLRSSTVSGAFGVTPVAAGAWPLKADDQRGSQLIGTISSALQLKDYGLSQEAFTKLRILAQDGSEALEAILVEDPTSPDHFEKLVQEIYTWAISFRNYSSVAPS
jgi:hypothetical protein